MEKKNIVISVLLTIVLIALALTAGYLVGTGKIDKTNKTDKNETKSETNVKETDNKENEDSKESTKQYTINDSLIINLSSYIPESTYSSQNYSKTPVTITFSEKDMIGIAISKMVSDNSNVKYENIPLTSITNKYVKEEVCATTGIVCGNDIKARVFYTSDLSKKIEEIFGKTITSYPESVSVYEGSNNEYIKYNNLYYGYNQSRGGAYQTVTKKIESVTTENNTITINYTFAIKDPVNGNVTNKTLSEKFSCDNNEHCTFINAQVK